MSKVSLNFYSLLNDATLKKLLYNEDLEYSKTDSYVNISKHLSHITKNL